MGSGKKGLLEERVRKLEARNGRVELDEVWESSWARRGLLAVFTFLSVGFYFQAIQVPSPWLNAAVPIIAFMLSTLTLPFFKSVWVNQFLG